MQTHQNRVLLGAGVIRRDDRISVESNITSGLSLHLLFSAASLLLVIHGDGELLGGESTEGEGLGGGGNHLGESAACNN